MSSPAPSAHRLRRRLAELRTDGPPAGREWCTAWTAAVDEALTELHHESVHRDRITLAGIGGYGRGELCPWSDIDLLLLHEDLETPALEVAVREIVYPLWDAGLTVGYAVRSRREAARIGELEDVTATLDARFVAGSRPVVADVTARLVRSLRRRPEPFMAALADADRQRHARRGDAAEVLEPDLRNGAGGLRDVQSLRWAAAALVGEPRLDVLVSGSYLGAADRGRVARAYERVLTERVALHLGTTTPGDTLGLEEQPEVAARLGYEDGADDRDTASHRLLTDHYRTARTIDHIHRRAWALMSSDLRQGRRRLRAPDALLDGFPIADGVLEITARDRLEDAELPSRLLAAMATSGAVLSRNAAQRLRRAVDELPAPLVWSPAAADRLLTALWLGEPTLPATYELDDVGLLVALLPEWAPLRGRAQRNPYHRFSLDRHALHTAAALGEMVRHEEWAATTLEEVRDRDGLMLGALLHDVGKAHGEPHQETGRAVAGRVVERLGFGASTRALVDRLVRLHLLLPRTATRRDLSDPDVIGSVAAEVGDRETLACLHLLAAADGRATGPNAWTTWTAALVEQLAVAVRAALDRSGRVPLAERAVATAREAQTLAAEREADPDAVRAHLAALPMQYASASAADVVVRHAGLAASLAASPEGDDLAVAVDPAPGVGVRVLVAGRDRPGLLAVVTGTVALARGSVVEAHAHTRTDGVAVQSLLVRPPEHPSATWVGELVTAVRERSGEAMILAADLEERRRRHRPAGGALEVDTQITIAHTSRASVVEIRTRDRLGLLHLATSILTALGYDITSVKAVLEGPRAIDSFTVRRRDGQPVDADAEAELELALLAALGEAQTTEAALGG